MNSVVIPEGYKACLDLYETQKAITIIKRSLESEIEQRLNLKRVSAPLFVNPQTGLNDNLNGVERPVVFDIPAANIEAEVIHSLAKWKRMALFRYDFNMGKGLYTNMNAIRRDENLDNLHSIYVDQWDWEKIIAPTERNTETLQEIVRQICYAIYETHQVLKLKFPQIRTQIPKEPYFITSQELLDRYPNLTAKQREYAITKEHK
ncbi:MAG: aspartate--ammonia ligase, partial [Eubacteriales bacterium]|nr:aspartate--ammonia ligase [Eubacteriales bacterium]